MQYQRLTTCRSLATLLATLLCSMLAFAQKPEYEFYYKFRTEFQPKLQEANHWSLTNQQVFEAYAAQLRNDGITETEIARRIKLLRTDHTALDADYYSPYYLDANSNFNHEPNAFLMEVVKARRAGVALDYGMGQGRNSIYLASLGWDVWGFDPADAGIAIAQKRAKELGLTLHTAAVADREYDFGKERLDLVLFSWTKPLVPVQKVIDSITREGIGVMECGQEFVPEPNALPHPSDSLRIVHYEIVRTKADWGDRRETDVFRLVAQKP